MTIRVGIVGTGGISRAHQRAYARGGRFRDRRSLRYCQKQGK